MRIVTGRTLGTGEFIVYLLEIGTTMESFV